MRKCLLLLILSLLLIGGNAYGNNINEIKGLQPVDPYGVFSTFSAESFPRGKAGVSVGAEVSLDPDLYRLIFKTAYGITNNLELDITAPYACGSGTPDGFEDVAFGLKHRFFEEGKYGPSLAYILTGSVPSGAEHLTTGGRYGAGFIVSKRVGPVNGHMNLFYEKPGDGDLRSEISLLTGLDFAAAHNFQLLAELLVRRSHFAKKVNSMEGRIGYRLKTTDSIYTTFGLGYDFKNRSPQTRIMFSVTFLLPWEKKKIKKIYEEE
jgi:hypothetical protein